MPVEHASVVVEADGGSRGNPGQAAYGAVLMRADTGEVIAERAECIGVATNNVAEYRGLLAGLELYNEHSPDADLEVRMDSKLVVEQMSGNWKIRHPDMRPLAMAAHRLAPFGTTYTWIPREQNQHADRLLNEALDVQSGKPSKKTDRAPLMVAEEGAQRPSRSTGGPGRIEDLGTPTTMLLVRHGETAHTGARRFSGRGGDDPALTADGAAQARATADWLAPLAEEIDALVSSPLRGAQETAEIIAARLDRAFGVEDGLVEAAPGGGDSIAAMDQRVRRTRDRLLKAYPGRSVLAVSPVTPIKLMVRMALDAPLEAVYRMELAPASVSVISWYEDGRASVRMLNARPMESAFIGG